MKHLLIKFRVQGAFYPGTYMLIITIFVVSILLCSCKSETNTKKDTGIHPIKTEMSADLVRANQLTQLVFNYVEKVETKQMTQEEADKLSKPYKRELQALRMQLSQEELIKNDSIRLLLGNRMVDNVMKWREENGLIKPEDQGVISNQ